MNKTETIWINGYNMELMERRHDNSEELYSVGDLLEAVDNAGGWDDPIAEGYSAAEILLTLAEWLDLDPRQFETWDNLYEAILNQLED